MIQKLLAACAAPLLVACAHGLGAPPTAPLGHSEFVEAIRDYKPRDVPAAFQHLVDWHAGTEPVVLVFTAGGRRACAITPHEATRVVLRRPFRCRWSAAR